MLALTGLLTVLEFYILQRHYILKRHISVILYRTRGTGCCWIKKVAAFVSRRKTFFHCWVKVCHHSLCVIASHRHPCSAHRFWDCCIIDWVRVMLSKFPPLLFEKYIDITGPTLWERKGSCSLYWHRATAWGWCVLVPMDHGNKSTQTFMYSDPRHDVEIQSRWISRFGSFFS